MDKITKILLLTNLLYHRRYITLDEIRRTCNICDRTAYRYINTISDANIPVYYDRDLGGYRLLSDGSFSTGDLKTHEVIIIATALKLFSKKLNGLYCQEINNLMKRIFSSQNLPIEELWQAFEKQAEAAFDAEDLSSILNMLNIHAAVQYSRKLNISVTDSASDIKRVEIEEPYLCFKDEWQVSGKKLESQGAIPISIIKKATVG